MFFAGLAAGLVLGLGLGLLLGRAGSRASVPSTAQAGPAAAAGDNGEDDTPLLDSILGIDPDKVKHGSAADSESTVDQLRQNLRVKLLHDEAKVQQAIKAEKRRDPDGGEEEWIRSAIHRWERDNR